MGTETCLSVQHIAHTRAHPASLPAWTRTSSVPRGCQQVELFGRSGARMMLMMMTLRVVLYKQLLQKLTTTALDDREILDMIESAEIWWPISEL